MLAMASYNVIGTRLPGSTLRVAALRLWGARIAPGTVLQRGTTVLGIERLVIGEGSSIGARCLLDARGDLRIGRRVRVGADTQFITANHDPNTDDFAATSGAIVIGDSVALGNRVTVLQGVTIGQRAAVAPSSLVRTDVAAGTVVDGIPARAVVDRLQASS
jgi:putative colanic acid biosynthesis acetyltransferase WcaF